MRRVRHSFPIPIGRVCFGAAKLHPKLVLFKVKPCGVFGPRSHPECGSAKPNHTPEST